MSHSPMGGSGHWHQQGALWTLEPHRPGPPVGLVEFIGGTVLAASPQFSYRRLLEAFGRRGWQVRAWSYVPGFDHQAQANEAWRAFRAARRESREGETPPASVLRIGHSLGCKLHLLAPDGGRRSDGFAALSFNNYSASRSVPLLAEMGQQLGFRSEFSPSPQETLRLVAATWYQTRNLLVRFRRDDLDQSRRLLAVLQGRDGDASELLDLPGDHLTPASAGLRRYLLGNWADDPARTRQIEDVAESILRRWS